MAIKIPGLKEDGKLDFGYVEKNFIKKVNYSTDETFIVCTITAKNNMKFIGSANVIVENNFIEDIGRKVAYTKALDDFLPCVAYNLKEKLLERGLPCEDPLLEEFPELSYNIKITSHFDVKEYKTPEDFNEKNKNFVLKERPIYSHETIYGLLRLAQFKIIKSSKQTKNLDKETTIRMANFHAIKHVKEYHSSQFNDTIKEVFISEEEFGEITK